MDEGHIAGLVEQGLPNCSAPGCLEHCQSDSFIFRACWKRGDDRPERNGWSGYADCQGTKWCPTKGSESTVRWDIRGSFRGFTGNNMVTQIWNLYSGQPARLPACKSARVLW